MIDTESDTVDPITSHLRDAAECIRSANRVTYADRREVIDLDDTLGALSALLHRLHQLTRHLHRIIERADAEWYETDNGSPAAEALNAAEIALEDTLGHLITAGTAVDNAWSVIGILRIHDPDSPSPN